MLRIVNATKRFGGVQALRGVDLEVDAGSVHALLGHNGAGKSTLIRALSGASTLDAGTIELDGELVELASPRAAIAAGISTIHQSLSLVDELTVAENIYLGGERRAGILVNRRAQLNEAGRILDDLGLPGVQRRRVGSLSTGAKQLVEIAKALRRDDPRVLILDEPTAALTHAEVVRLFEQIKRLRARGLHLIYVTHRLAEVEQIADQVTILKNGEVVLSGDAARLDRDEIYRAIAPGRTGTAGMPTATTGGAVGAAVLEVRGLRGSGLAGVDLQAMPGEVTGIYGPLGSGGSALLDIVAGARHGWQGEMVLNGRPHAPATPAGALRSGVALVPSDRRARALFGSMSVIENVLLPALPGFAWTFLRRRRRERRAFAATAELVNLIPRDPRIVAGSLSGGNQQKAVLARWLTLRGDLDLLLLDEPTQGIDVGARDEIYKLLHATAREFGLAVLFNSADVEEVAAVADRVYVVVDGAVTGVLNRDQLSEGRLLDLAHQ